VVREINKATIFCNGGNGRLNWTDDDQAALKSNEALFTQ
jgi:hypothetical protein